VTDRITPAPAQKILWAKIAQSLLIRAKTAHAKTVEVQIWKLTLLIAVR
jgi:hypothetical protein